MKLNKGTLSSLGYSTKDLMRNRRAALKKAVNKYGYLTVFRKLNAVATLTKNTSPGTSKVLLKDRDWVRKEYM
jgi:hypothetical protein